MSDTLPDPAPPAPPAPGWAPPEPGTAVTDDPRPTSSPRQTIFFAVAMVALLVFLGVQFGWGVPVVILALLVMIFLHELGHFMTARWTGMKATEFFIGFGPRLWSFRRGEVEYGMKAVLLGAYVRIIGMTNLEEVDPADEDRTYRSKPYPSRVLVAAAGSLMHFLLAIVLLFASLAIFGRPSDSQWSVGTIVPGSPAAAAGVHLGDRIVAFNGQPVSTYDAMRQQIREMPGKTTTLTVERGGSELALPLTLAATNPQGEAVGFLGVGAVHPDVSVPVTQAVPQTFTEFGRIAWDSVAGLGHIFSPGGIRDYVDNLTSSPTTSSASGTPTAQTDNGSNRLVSPVGAVSIGAQLAETGTGQLLLFLAAVNIFVGLFNLIPLLPFDGGHIAIATYEAIRSRKGRPYHADVRKMLPVTYGVVLVLAVLFVGNFYLDLTRPVQLP